MRRYITSARGHELRGCVHAYAYNRVGIIESVDSISRDERDSP